MNKRLLLIAVMFGFCLTSFSENGVDMAIKKIKALMKESSAKPGTASMTYKSPTIYFNKIEKILDIDGWQIPLQEVKISYTYEAKFQNHCVSFDCRGHDCIFESGEYHSGFSAPFISKQKCYEFIELINQLNN